MSETKDNSNEQAATGKTTTGQPGTGQPGTGQPGTGKPVAGLDSKELAIKLANLAHDRRCEQIVVLDLRGVSPITDFFVVCTGTSDRQMRTTGEEMMVECKHDGDPPYGHSGLDSASWVLIDFVNVVVHIFTPEHRAYYDLELLWGDAPRIEWQNEQA